MRLRWSCVMPDADPRVYVPVHVLREAQNLELENLCGSSSWGSLPILQSINRNNDQARRVNGMLYALTTCHLQQVTCRFLDMRSSSSCQFPISYFLRFGKCRQVVVSSVK